MGLLSSSIHYLHPEMTTVLLTLWNDDSGNGREWDY